MPSNEDSQCYYVMNLHFASPQIVPVLPGARRPVQRDISTEIKKKLNSTRFFTHKYYSDEVCSNFVSPEMMRD